MPHILQKESPVLRGKATAVDLGTIKSPAFKKILKDMKSALATQFDGVALAAPQIGAPLRLFIVSGRTLRKRGEKKTPPDAVFINPTLVKISKKKTMMEEGCLSVRPLYGRVKRASKATVRAYDEKGKLFEQGASGLLAQIFQHECDHLDGILFVDRAEEVWELEGTDGKEAGR